MLKKIVSWLLVLVLTVSYQWVAAPQFASNSSSTGPSLAYNPASNNYLMVYKSSTSGSAYEILGQFLSSTGSAQGDIIEISNVASENTDAPEVIYNSEQESFYVTWQDGREDHSQVMVSILDGQGNTINDDFKVDASSTKHQLTPLISRNPSEDRTVILWLEADEITDSAYNLVGAYIDESDLSSEELSFTKKSDVLSFDVTYDTSANEFVVVWDSKINQRTRLNVKYIDSSGDIKNGTTFISPGDGEVTAPSVTYSESADQNLIVWVDEDNSIDDVYTKYTTVSGTAIKVFSADENTEITDISITSQGTSDELLLVWTEYDGTDYSVIGNFVNDDGTSTGADDIVIVESSSEPVETIIAFNNEDDNFLVMQDDGSGEPVQTDVGVIGDVSYGALEFESLTSSVGESGNFQVVVERKNGTDGTVYVDYSTVSGSAGSEDFIAVSGTLEFLEGVSEATLSVPIIEDNIDEEDEYFDIELSGATGGAGIGSISTHTVTILDDDDPNGTFDFSTSSDSVLEGQSLEVIIERSLGQNGLVTVDYSTQLQSASSNDLVQTSGTLVFADGQTTKTILIDTTEDSMTEDDETFALSLSGTTGGSELGNTSSMTVTIIDDDQKTESVGFSDASASVTEGGTVNLKVVRTGLLDNGLTIDYTTDNGSATQSDFSSSSGTLVFDAGDTEKTITIDTVEDSFVEGAENFDLLLSNPTGPGYLGEISQMTVVIEDNDSQVEFQSETASLVEGQSLVFTLTRQGDLSGEADIDYVITEGTATGSDLDMTSGTVTFESGTTTKNINVQTYEDNLVEADEDFYIDISNPTGNMTLGSITRKQVTITDNDVETESFNFKSTSGEVKEGQTLLVDVLRSGSLSGASSVDYELSYDTASAEDIVLSNGTLNFLQDIDEASISVEVTDDTLLEEAEIFQLNLTNPSGTATVGDNASYELTIVDNDIQIGFEKEQTNIIEGSSTAVTLIRQGDLSGVSTVDYASQAQTADASDFTSLDGQVTFAVGESRKNITLTATEDEAVEETETFMVSLSGPSENVLLSDIDQVTVNIADNDNVNALMTFSKDAYALNEGETYQIEVLRLGTLVGTLEVDFEVQLQGASPSDYDLESGPIIFSDGESSKMIQVLVLEDSISENDESLQLILSEPAGDAELGAIDQVTLNIQDNDSQVEFSKSTGSVVEGQNYETLLSRTGTLSGSATVTYTVVAGTAGELDIVTGSDTIVFQSGEVSKTVQVSTIDDTLVENTESFTIQLESQDENVEIGSKDLQTVSLIENDINVDTFNFSASELDIDEGESGTVKILRAGTLEGSMTVSYSLEDGTASSDDHALEPGTIQFNDGESEKTLIIQTSEDSKIEESESFKISLDGSTGYSKIGSLSQVLVNINDDDSSFTFGSNAYSVVEGETANLVVSRAGDLSLVETVEYTATSVTAGESDYSMTPGTLTFGLGQSSQTISVQTIDDGLTEDAETLKVVLSSPSESAFLGDIQEATVTISDNDDQMTVFNLSSSSKSISEGDGAEISVTRTGSSSGQASVLYSVSSGTASLDDYEMIAGTLAFEDGETVKTIDVRTIDDGNIETTEYFTLSIVSPSEGAKLGSLSSMKINILDNDALVDSASFESGIQTVQEGENIQLLLERTGDLQEEATIEYLVANGTATSSDVCTTKGTITFGVGEASVEIEIPVVLDSQNEDDEYLYVLLHNPSSGLEVGDVSTVIVVIENTEPPIEENRKSSQPESSGASSAESSQESASVVTSLSNVLIGKATGENDVQPQTITAYYSHIDQALDRIEDEASLRKAVESYVDGVGALSKVTDSEENVAWVESQLIERINVYSKTITALENHGDLTKDFLESIETIQNENEIDSSAVINEAIEKMASVTFSDIGTIRDKYAETVVDGVSEISFEPQDINGEIVNELGTFNQLNALVDNYYGDKNVRNFSFDVTLVAPKTRDDVRINLSKDLLQVAEDNSVDNLALQVGGTSVILDYKDLKNEVTGYEDMTLDLNYSSEANGRMDGQLLSSSGYLGQGYSVDVTLKVNGLTVDRFEKPLRLRFDMDEFGVNGDLENVNKLSAFRFNEDRNLWEPVGGRYDPVTNTFTVFRQNLSQYTVMQSNKSFNDIDSSSAKEDIEELLGKGIIDETVSFNPEENITREEVATWVARSYGLESDEDMPFEDIPKDSDHYEALAGAYGSGVFSGTSETSFNPDGYVTKEEMAVILANAMTQFDQKKLNDNLGGELASLSDSELIEEWAEDEVALLNELGFMTDEQGNVNPDEQLSKEEAAELLKKVFG